MKRLIAVFAVALFMVFSTVAPALGQTQIGLVNVMIDDVIVAVPVAVAANICGIDANVLAVQFVGEEEIACEADADAIALVPRPFRP
jgi:uncharacterized membrane protein